MELIGPDIRNIRNKRELGWLLDFVKDSKKLIEANDPQAVSLYKEFRQTEMPANTLTDSQIVAVFNYVDQYNYSGTTGEEFARVEEQGNQRILLRPFIIILILLLPVFLAVFFSIKKKKKHPVTFFLIVYILLVLVISICWISGLLTQARNDKSRLGRIQPVIFDHQVHYRDYDIDCIYCHIMAVKNRVANTPGVDVCMKCHTYIREGETYKEKEIGKLIALYESGEQIRWVAGYRIPPYVRFNHELHNRIAGLDCLNCHSGEGDPVITSYSFTMGWCIDCHRQHKPDMKNHFYADSIYTVINSVVETGGENCLVCHY